MTMSVRFRLSYDRFKRDFIVFKVDIFMITSKAKRNVITDVVMTLHVLAKMLCNVCSYDFYHMTSCLRV